MTAEGQNPKLLGALGLAKRAGKLCTGFDAVCKAAAKGEAVLVFISADTSAKTAKRATAACQGHCQVLHICLSQNSIAAITHKPAGVLAVTDKDLATLCQKAIENAVR